MKLDIFLSEEATDVIEDSLEQMRSWDLHAVNSLILFKSLFQSEESGLEDFFLSEDVMKQEAEDTIYDQCRIMKIKLEIKDDDQKKKEKKSKKYKSEESSIFIFKDFEGQEIAMPCSEGVEKIFKEVIRNCEQEGIECIKPLNILVAMFAVKDEDCRSIFVDLEIDYYKASKYFTESLKYTSDIIPYELSGFLTNLNKTIEPDKPCEILERDDEIEQIWNISLKRNKRNTVLVGEAGVGKSALIEKITYDIVTENCPERFVGFYVISLDVNSLIAGTTYRGQAEERIKKLINFLKKNQNVILFIDEVHTILGAGSCFEGEMDLSNALKPILARGESIVIGATTHLEYEKYFKVDAALSRRFEMVEVEEPQHSAIHNMLKNKIAALEEFHQVKISKKVVQFCILIADVFCYDRHNPDKTLDLIDKSMVITSRMGRKMVTKQCVLENLSDSLEIFENVSQRIKEVLAYHEIGHFVVGRMSSYAFDNEFFAVSILPFGDFGGLTVAEPKEDVLTIPSKKYLIDEIAFHLGGRAAEEIFLEEISGGASEDINGATKLAFEYVTKMCLGKNQIFFENSKEYPMFSEKARNMINSKVNKIIKKSYKRAKEILEENVELVEELVQAVLLNKILGKEELEAIVKKYL